MAFLKGIKEKVKEGIQRKKEEDARKRELFLEMEAKRKDAARKAYVKEAIKQSALKARQSARERYGIQKKQKKKENQPSFGESMDQYFSNQF